MMRTFFFYLAIIAIHSCIESTVDTIDEMAQEPIGYANVDQQLWPYFAQFEEAARSRDITVDLRSINITGHITSIDDGNIVGQCSYGGRQRTYEVTIDQAFWDRANNSYREYIVFHELGHCYLFRDHTDACLSNRTWASIMRSGTEGQCRDNYTSVTRDYYLDELFEMAGN